MPLIKYYLTVFIALLSTHNYAQNKNEQNGISTKDSITAGIYKSERFVTNNNLYDAILVLKQTKTIADRSKDKKNQGLIYSKIAEIHYLLNDQKNAKTTIEKAIRIQSEINDDLNLAVSQYTKGLIYLKDKLYAQALEYFNISKLVLEKENCVEVVAEVSLKQAICAMRLNHLEAAHNFIKQAITIGESYKLSKIKSAAHIKNSVLHFKKNNLNTALLEAQKGLDISKTIEDLALISEGYINLSNIYKAKGDYKRSNNNLWAHIAIKDSIQALKDKRLSPEKSAQFTLNQKEAKVLKLQGELTAKEENESLEQLTTTLSVALIMILSFLTLSLYKNNNIRTKTNNMLYDKNDKLLGEKERVEIAAKTKTKFLSTVTHELRTPLYAVIGLTNMLLDEDPKPEQIKHLKALKFSGDYLLTFINDILQVNKIEANKIELDPEIFNLKHKIKNVISSLNNSASSNNTTIHFQYDKNLPKTYEGDQLKISQILINLIGNSIKFTKNGDIWVSVSQLTKNGNAHHICIEVKDNGIGITKEKQAHMFDSFSQGSVQINRKYGGTGLGLSIVKGLVDILKGTIYLKSELGKGSSFFIEITLKEAKKLAAPTAVDYTKSIKDLGIGNINILVVEDNKINQMITKKTLAKMNIDCELVDNGEEAVSKVKANNYHVVLMDIHMPGISGLEATKRIRVFNKELIIFALTAVTLEDKMQEFDDAGFNSIISKPFKQEDFEKTLYTALAQKKAILS